GGGALNADSRGARVGGDGERLEHVASHASSRGQAGLVVELEVDATEDTALACLRRRLVEAGEAAAGNAGGFGARREADVRAEERVQHDLGGAAEGAVPGHVGG